MSPRIAGIFALLVVTSIVAPAAMSSGDAFRGSVSPIPPSVRETMTGVSWRPGCPVGLDDLRLVRARFVGFDGARAHRAGSSSTATSRPTWSRCCGGSTRRGSRSGAWSPSTPTAARDFRSIEADNTSAFNCRYVDGTTRWSEHAYGRAIDLNPIENPYVTSSGTTSHPASRPYLRRAPYRPGMAVEGGALVRAFDAVGWGWGGRWSGARDYQHFSASGR